MSQPQYEPDFEDDPRVSPRLAGDLSDLFGPVPRVSGAVDQRVLSSARAHLARGATRRWRLTPPLRWAGTAAAAAAAVVVLVVRFALVSPDAPRPAPQQASAIPADVDGSGRVDVLDALVLARRIESDSSDARDLTGDGVADRRDVDLVAMLAVSLQREGVR